MAEIRPKTLADDYYERLAKTFRQEFIDNVDNPTHLIDHLRCLERMDEELIRAQQTQKGPMRAASVLYDRLIRRPNWIEDVIRALRDPGVKLDFLAEKLERFELTVPARWDICGFKDGYGRACFNGHCSDFDADGLLSLEELKVTSLPEQTPPKATVDKPLDSENLKVTSLSEEQTPFNQPVNTDKEIDDGVRNFGVENEDKATVPSVSKDRDVNSSASANISKTEPENVNDPREDILLRRENLRLTLMEKVCSLIKTPEDVPVAIQYMNEINLQVIGIHRGSVLFDIYIGSLEALQTFEQLWRYGGLKKLLDKEMLDKDMIKELKAVANKAGHPVGDIQSDLKVFETDIERCRSWLIKKSFDVSPMNFSDALVLKNNKRSDRETEITTEVAKYATDRLPEELQDLIEDPFISDRIGSFYESEQLKRKFTDERRGSISEQTVSQCFVKWLYEVLSTYVKSLDDKTVLHFLSLAVYLVHKVESGDTTSIPYQALSESFAVPQITKHFPTETYDRSFWFDLLKLPSEFTVDNKTLRNACKELSDKRLVCQSKRELNFRSTFLRDIFVTKVVLCSSFKGSLKTIVESFEYVQTLMGMYKMMIKNYISHQAEAEFAECAFKTPELREIGLSGRIWHVAGLESSFYNQDLLHSRSDTIKATEELSDAGTKIKRNLRINEKAKCITADISKALNDKSLTIDAALHWLNVMPLKGYCYTRSLFVNNYKIAERDLDKIGLYLNTVPDGLDLSLRNCQLDGYLLATALETGQFRNIWHLNISDNMMLGESSQPLGLMYIRSLERLEIQNCNLGDDGMKFLSMDLLHAGKLRELNVANNRVSSKGLLELTKALATNKRMTGLRIHKNYIGKEGSLILASWLESLILLEVLNISECGIGDKGSAVIAKALVSRSLRKLSMRKNELSTKGSRDFFKNFQHSPYLEHLDFSENALFTLSDIRSYAAADDLPPSAKDEPFVEFLQHPTPMSHLSLWNTCAGEKRIFQGLQSYKRFEEMTYLCLQENNISDDFVKDLSECIRTSHCAHLQHFNLRQNRIGTMGAMDIANALSTQRYLKEVLLDRNEIRDDGGNKIVKSCVILPVIQYIDLSCNYITPKMLERIVHDLETRVSSVPGNDDSDDAAFSETKEDIREDYNTIGADLSSTHIDIPGIDTPLGISTVIKKQDSHDENSFIISREGDKFVITF